MAGDGVARRADAAAVAGERVLLADQAVEGRAAQPGLLDELELPLDVAVQAHEQQARFLPPFSGWYSRGRRGRCGAGWR